MRRPVADQRRRYPQSYHRVTAFQCGRFCCDPSAPNVLTTGPTTTGGFVGLNTPTCTGAHPVDVLTLDTSVPVTSHVSRYTSAQNRRGLYRVPPV